MTIRWSVIVGDLVEQRVDAIVNAANPALLGGGGVDGAIHRAAGGELLRACRAIGGCPVGEARITPGFRLPARHVIHAVGPIWQGGGRGEAALLARAYTAALVLAEREGLESVAFPALSAGAYGYPLREALAVGAAAISGFGPLARSLRRIRMVAYGEAAGLAWRSVWGGAEGDLPSAAD